MISTSAGELLALSRRLRQAGPVLAAADVVAGFDGFVDEMITLVAERTGPDLWSALGSMAEFGALISSNAGRNCLREIIVRREEAGGCAVNFGDGMAGLGFPVSFFGTLGSPRHRAFENFAERCRSCTTWGDACGRTLAFEFADGKCMFSAVSQLGSFDADCLERCLADGNYARACARAPLIALTNWTLYPRMTACWRLLQDRVFAHLEHQPWLLIDLVDPSGRSPADIRDMLAAMAGFTPRCRTVLGLNRTEAGAISTVLDLGAIPPDPGALGERAALLRERIGVHTVVIHGARINAAAAGDGVAETYAGPFCTAPVKTTGAGDRFNAGLALGLVLRETLPNCLLLGSAVSGCFIRTARSPDRDRVCAFLEDWAGEVAAGGREVRPVA